MGSFSPYCRIAIWGLNTKWDELQYGEYLQVGVFAPILPLQYGDELKFQFY
jgi:hypothetical protein